MSILLFVCLFTICMYFYMFHRFLFFGSTTTAADTSRHFTDDSWHIYRRQLGRGAGYCLGWGEEKGGVKSFLVR